MLELISPIVGLFNWDMETNACLAMDLLRGINNRSNISHGDYYYLWHTYQFMKHMMIWRVSYKGGTPKLDDLSMFIMENPIRMNDTPISLSFKISNTYDVKIFR